jgi:hypothetical protein
MKAIYIGIHLRICVGTRFLRREAAIHIGGDFIFHGRPTGVSDAIGSDHALDTGLRMSNDLKQLQLRGLLVGIAANNGQLKTTMKNRRSRKFWVGSI